MTALIAARCIKAEVARISALAPKKTPKQSTTKSESDVPVPALQFPEPESDAPVPADPKSGRAYWKPDCVVPDQAYGLDSSLQLLCTTTSIGSAA